MTSPFQTFAISGDALIGLIAVVVWIVLSVAGKRAKPEQKTTPPPLTPTPGDGQSPQDELRKFFETLEKNMGAPATEETPPVQQAPRAPVRARKAVPAPSVAAYYAPPAPASLASPEPAQAPVPEAPAATPSPVPLAVAPAHRAPPRIQLDALRSRQGLQYAIVAAEILGSPVSMRRPGSSAGALASRQ